MKKLVLTLAVVVISLVTSEKVPAQKRPPMPDFASWQLVSDAKDKSKVTVQFFSNNNELMYEETLHHIKLDITKKKTVQRLNAVLKDVHTAWVCRKIKVQESKLVAKSFQP